MLIPPCVTMLLIPEGKAMVATLLAALHIQISTTCTIVITWHLAASSRISAYTPAAVQFDVFQIAALRWRHRKVCRCLSNSTPPLTPCRRSERPPWTTDRSQSPAPSPLGRPPHAVAAPVLRSTTSHLIAPPSRSASRHPSRTRNPHRSLCTVPASSTVHGSTAHDTRATTKYTVSSPRSN